jgi:hypothetical protein
MVRAAETLTDEESAKLHDVMRAADPSGWLEKCWQGKEILWRLLTLAGTEPDRNLIWTRLTDFYTHCADSEVAQLRRLAWTVHAWQPSTIEGLITGISSGRTEGYNRIVRHVGRIAFGFRSTENHKRRIRFACTRSSRRAPTRAPKPFNAEEPTNGSPHSDAPRSRSRCGDQRGAPTGRSSNPGPGSVSEQLSEHLQVCLVGMPFLRLAFE